MNSRTFPWFILLLASICAVPIAAFADALSDVSLVAEKGQLLYTTDYFALNGANRTIVVTVKATWIEMLAAHEQIFKIEAPAGEKILAITQQPQQTNFNVVIIDARYTKR